MHHSNLQKNLTTGTPHSQRLFQFIKQSSTSIQAIVIILGLNVASLFSPAWDLFLLRIQDYLNWKAMMLSPEIAMREAERFADVLIENPTILQGIQELMVQVVLIHAVYILFVWGILFAITQSFKSLVNRI
jgi:hypothetical protein